MTNIGEAVQNLDPDEALSPPRVEIPVIEVSHYQSQGIIIGGILDNTQFAVPRVKNRRTGAWEILMNRIHADIVSLFPEDADPDFKYPILLNLWHDEFWIERIVLYRISDPPFQNSISQMYAGVMGVPSTRDFMSEWNTHLPSANVHVDPFNQVLPTDATKRIMPRGKVTIRDETIPYGIVNRRRTVGTEGTQETFNDLDLSLEFCFKDGADWATELSRIQAAYGLSGQSWSDIYNAWNMDRRSATYEASRDIVITESLVRGGDVRSFQKMERLMKLSESNKVTLFHEITAYVYDTVDTVTIPEGEEVAIVDWEPPTGQKPMLTRPVKVYWNDRMYWVEKQSILTNQPATMEAAMRDRKTATEIMVAEVRTGSSPGKVLDRMLGPSRRGGQDVTETLAKNPFTEQEAYRILRGNEEARKAVMTLVATLRDAGHPQDYIRQFFHVIPDVLIRLTQEQFLPAINENHCPSCGGRNIHEEEGMVVCEGCDHSWSQILSARPVCGCGAEFSSAEAMSEHECHEGNLTTAGARA